MILHCCLSYPTIMLKKEVVEEVKYESGTMEDYRLWLKSSLENKLKFANIGIVLLKLRKHNKNYSNNQTLEDEIEFKMPFLLQICGNEENLYQKIKNNKNIVKDFINATIKEKT